MIKRFVIKIIFAIGLLLSVSLPVSLAQNDLHAVADLSSQKVKEAEAIKDNNQKLVLLNEAIQLNPKNDSAYIERADVYKELHEEAVKQINYGAVNYKEKALDDVEKAIALNPSAWNYLKGSFVYSAVRYSKDKREYDAIQKKYEKFLEEAIKRHPKEGSLYLERGMLNVNNYDGSVEVDSNIALYHKAILEDCVHFGSPLTKSQINDYMTFLELESTEKISVFSLAYMTCGDLLFSYRKGVKGIDLQRIADILDKMIENNPETYDLRLRRIAINSTLNLPDTKAIGDYEKLAEFDAKNADAYFAKLGDIYYVHHNYDKAIEHYSKSLQCAAYADVYNSRGNAYSKIGEHDKAKEDYQRASELDAVTNNK